MADEVQAPESQIQQMLAGATVLLTGGTGFLGKLLIEKLLRSCPDLKKLYLLIRPKKNEDPITRIAKQFDDVLYNTLRDEQPDFFRKIALVEGDVGHKGLSISEKDNLILTHEVEFIFHGAATVRFDEALKTAVEVNVRGSREMLALARACTRLRAYVHISTAYSNCTLKHIEEKFYNTSMEGDKLIHLVENMDETLIKNITPGLVGDFPNTYSYTKAAAEDIVLKHSKGLPVAVVRPSIVICTAKEPVPGWVDNFHGTTGAVAGVCVGIVRVLPCDSSVAVDLVPGDMVVNVCIAAAWSTARGRRGDVPTIYNFVCSDDNKITYSDSIFLLTIDGILRDYMKCVQEQGFKMPPKQMMWYYTLYLIKSKLWYDIAWFLLHTLPAYLGDGVLFLIGKEPILRKIYRKIQKFSDLNAYFSLNEWSFASGNTRELLGELSEADRRAFGFDMSQLPWREYLRAHFAGIRLHLLREPLATLPAARARLRLFALLHYLLLSLLGLLLYSATTALINFLF